MPLREDEVAPRSVVLDQRTLVQVGGFALAIAATLAVFLTDDPQFLRLAVVGVAWAFVLATFAAGRRSTDRVAARAREAELRQAYEFELEREVAARREYELELETELRREAEEAMRAELDALRADLAGASGLRDELARLADLRSDIGTLSSLRDEVAQVAALRDDVAALTSLRQELGQLAELRADMGRLRAELTEQLSSEMLVERIVMRTQASRLTSEANDAPGRTLDAARRWADDVPPRELTGGWPAVRLDEPRETRQFDQVRVERAAARPPVPPASPVASPRPPFQPSPEPSWRPSWESGSAPLRRETPATAARESLSTPPADTPATASWESATADVDTAGQQAHGAAEPVPRTAAFVLAPPSDRSRGGAPPANSPVAAPPVVPTPAPEPPPSPLEWLAARSLIDAEPTSFRPEVPPRRRRGDEASADPAAAPTTQRPAVSPHPPIRIGDRGSHRVAVREDDQAERSGPPAREKRLADILAENGVSPATGGRRRRRYRDDDEADDVLARVLGND
ncbi:DUF6779 domain-containing protein [Blastococcus mobilis]|uniref:DUF6779 domain-containing protein n=1 Tax=Blastococcus mobilis TaxID=1938746 RepID=A0A238VZ92_9ACTN|nr:DUF6779 domain-containing protein [Blastococcus mobilis]SNR39424.1 hypothetical protein SAMN06272737_105180 [Blastococcus mobilis]